MPALPPVAGAIRTAISGSKSGKAWANILHWAYTGSPPSLSDVTAAATSLATLWNTYLAPRQTSDTEMTMVKVTDLSSAFGAQVEQAETVTGTNGEDPIPSNVAFLLDYDVSMRYRGGHPRTYLVAGGDGDLDSGGGDWNVWGSAFVTAVGTSWTNFTSHFSGQTFGAMTVGDLICIRYRSGGAPLVTPIVLPLPTFNTEVNVATQRRRVRFGS